MKKKVDLFNVNKVNPQILNKEHFDKLFSKKHLTIGQKAADTLTKFAGSWTFILGFFIVFILWISSNTYLLLKWNTPAFDPYPFILLNLVLSTVAALQAPIILMSQNRSSEMDRRRAELDYYINRKAEREIKILQKDIIELKAIVVKQPLKGETDAINTEIKKIEAELKNLKNLAQGVENSNS